MRKVSSVTLLFIIIIKGASAVIGCVQYLCIFMNNDVYNSIYFSLEDFQLYV